MHESDPEVTLAMRHALNRLKLAEDYCDMFDRLVDMSDIASFGDGPARTAAHRPAWSTRPRPIAARLIYPGATAFAYINEIELRQIRARSRVFAQTNPYAIGAARNRMAYAVGSGHTYNVLPRDADRPARRCSTTAARCSTISASGTSGASGRRRPSAAWTATASGSCGCSSTKRPGELNVRFVEPLEVQNPPDKTSADGVYFGIQFARIGEAVDIETPLNYFLVNIGTLGESIGLRETVPAARDAAPQGQRRHDVAPRPAHLVRPARPPERRRADAEGHGQDRRVPRADRHDPPAHQRHEGER